MGHVVKRDQNAMLLSVQTLSNDMLVVAVCRSVIDTVVAVGKTRGAGICNFCSDSLTS